MTKHAEVDYDYELVVVCEHLFMTDPDSPPVSGTAPGHAGATASPRLSTLSAGGQWSTSPSLSRQNSGTSVQRIALKSLKNHLAHNSFI